jgi:hypothetical protein
MWSGQIEQNHPKLSIDYSVRNKRYHEKIHYFNAINVNAKAI